MVGYDHYGDDIKRMSGSTVQALATACDASPSCYAFNWSPYSYMVSGYLKTTGTSVSGKAGMCFYKFTSEQGLLSLMVQRHFDPWSGRCRGLLLSYLKKKLDECRI